MMKPKSIREAEAKMTDDTKAMQDKAGVALFDKTLTDEAADTIILASNADLAAAGMPAGGLTLTRAAFRAAWPKMGV